VLYSRRTACGEDLRSSRRRASWHLSRAIEFLQNSYKVDSEDLSFMPGEGVGIKYHMQKGAGMIYAWKATSNIL
jgi:hypothetical protein